MNPPAFPKIPDDRSDDLHSLGQIDTADLVIFMAGNQFMVMPELIRAFREQHPDIGPIFYETLPPGLELKQILAGGAIFQGKRLDVYPDVYTAVNEKAMGVLAQTGHIDPGGYRLYLHNRLALMVPPGNPAGIRSVTDLGRDDVRISQPDPENEDIAFHIVDMYRQAGGESLVRRIMNEKRAEGTTILTLVHHRETPLRIARRTVDVGPVWATETRHAGAGGLDFDVVEPGAALDQRGRINYYICRLKRARHPENGAKFVKFIRSACAQNIYSKYGFVSHTQAS